MLGNGTNGIIAVLDIGSSKVCCLIAIGGAEGPRGAYLAATVQWTSCDVPTFYCLPAR